MRQEVEQIITSLLEQEPPSFDQLDLGPEPTIPKLTANELTVLSVLVEEGWLDAGEVAVLSNMSQREEGVAEELGRLEELGLVFYEEVVGKWNSTAAGIALWDKLSPVDPMREQEEPDFDQIDFGEPLPELSIPNQRTLTFLAGMDGGQSVQQIALNVIRHTSAIELSLEYLKSQGLALEDEGMWIASEKGRWVGQQLIQQGYESTTEQDEPGFDQIDFGPSPVRKYEHEGAWKERAERVLLDQAAVLEIPLCAGEVDMFLDNLDAMTWELYNAGEILSGVPCDVTPPGEPPGIVSMYLDDQDDDYFEDAAREFIKDLDKGVEEQEEPSFDQVDFGEPGEPALSSLGKSVLGYLIAANRDVTAEDIGRSTGLTYLEVLPVLTSLEQQGLIFKNVHGRWHVSAKGVDFWLDTYGEGVEERGEPISTKDRVAEYLRGELGAVTLSTLAYQLDIPRRTAASAVGRLRKKGKVQKVKIRSGRERTFTPDDDDEKPRRKYITAYRWVDLQ